MTYRKLFIYEINGDTEQPIAIFDNPGTIPVQGSTVFFTKNGIVDVAGLEGKQVEGERMTVLSVIPSKDGEIEHFNVRVIKWAK